MFASKMIAYPDSMEILGNSAERDVVSVKKRVTSAAARAKIAKAAKRRWARFRAQAKKAAG